MDKITRVLLLYSKLIRGEPVNKISFCMETDISGRNFDRDIEDISYVECWIFRFNSALFPEFQSSTFRKIEHPFPVNSAARFATVILFLLYYETHLYI